MNIQKNTEKNLRYYNRIIFVLSIIGTVIAFYVLQSWLRKTGIICLTNGCETVRKSVFSYPFGIPVPAFGLVGYLMMVIFSFLRTTLDDKRLFYGILGIAIFGICFVSWFTFMEIFIIKGICTWCAISAVNMWIIFFFTIKSHFLFKNSK